MHRLAIILALAACAAPEGSRSSRCGSALPAGLSTRRLPSGRVFRLYVPKGYRGQPAPLLLDFHGRGSNAAQERLLTRFDEAADARNFLLVEPEGEGGEWNAGRCCGGADDVAFVREILDSLEREACVDRSRVHAVGMSNGGFFAQRLACELSDRVASIASVAGGLAVERCAPKRPVPVLLVNGTDDRVVPWRGIEGRLPSVETMEAGWAARNGCGAGREEVSRGRASRCEARRGCAADVVLCRIEGGGHTWPGGPMLPGLGTASSDLDATVLATGFFEGHPLR
jgi:polyhydroxybutyrate depolymerase